MKSKLEKIHSVIRRDQAGKYILMSLVGFAATVILTRTFLQLTGFPQIGNSVLHIAHALWGGLLLIVAFYLPLVFSNRWMLQISAVLGGIGIGLFIDEVGKFITQSNDYFYPPALPLIYSFILLNVLVLLYFRRPHKDNPRSAIYHVLEGMQDLIDGNLDRTKAARIEEQLIIARQSDQAEIASLADALSNYIDQHTYYLTDPENHRQPVTMWLDAMVLKFGRRRHHALISFIMIGWLILVASYIAIVIQGGDTLDPQVLKWGNLLIGIQVIIGVLLFFAVYFWLTNREELGLKFGVCSFLISLVALQLLYFYISQFMAITITLVQLTFLGLLLAYRRYFEKE